ncbi:MAG: tetratricopeptide repeat protein, partial [Armatimonadia bacterium]|nr:tetratricopeptide repeat protein [Armatimonadia bacterium]
WPFGRREPKDEEQPDPKERFKEGTRALERGDIDEAINVLSALVKEQPDYMAARVNLGHAYYSNGEFVAAARQFEEAHALEPDNPKVLLNQAAAKSALDQLDEAIDLLIEALNVDAQFRDVHYNLAIAYWRKGRRPEAMAELEMELALHPDHEPAKQAMARLKAEGGISEEEAPDAASNPLDDQQAEE